ncbi:MAG: GNAT family N-acetyltransferase [Ktedonobacterales bacterium]
MIRHIEEGDVLVTPRIESADANDLDTLARLRTEQGWQRSEVLLRAIQRWDHGRIFIVRAGSVDPATSRPHDIIASTSAIVAGHIGVIGTVIVRADFRRRGLGRLVMRACLDWMRGEGARVALLDATPEGRPLYFELGFIGVEQSYFGHADAEAFQRATRQRSAPGFRAALHPAADLPMIADLDRAAFGGDRLGFLAHFLELANASFYVVSDDARRPVAYALARHLDAPYVGVRLGPWVATSDDAATALLGAILADDAPWRKSVRDDGADPQIFVSMSGANTHATRLFETLGGALEEDDLIMRLDLASDNHGALPHVDTVTDRADPPATQVSAPLATHPDWLYGWIAPMVF